MTHALQTVHGVLRASQGQPLAAATRDAMERRLGRFFGGTSAGPLATGELTLGSPSDRHEHDADAIATARPERAAPAARARGVDLSAVRVYTDRRAAESAHALNAEAYTVGNDVVFASGRYAPGTALGDRVLAHELAHVAQRAHRGERESVVRRFTSFSAQEQAADDSMGWKHPAGTPLSVSDDGQMAAENNGWGRGKNKRAWTTPALVATSNEILKAQSSRAELKPKSGGPDLSGKAPANKQSASLTEIEPVRSDGGTFDLQADCGYACKQVMGSGFAGKDVAVIKGKPLKPSGTLGALAGGIARGLGLGAAASKAGTSFGNALEKAILSKMTPEERLKPRVYHARHPDLNQPQTSAEEWTEEVFRKQWGSGLTRTELYAKYSALTDGQKDAFDRKYGINNYAVPRVGQGITISSDYDMPGFAAASGRTPWNFHYAASVLSSGSDYVTLESAAGWQPTDWIFYMYGPASKKQSFKEIQAATETHGTKQTALVVAPE